MSKIELVRQEMFAAMKNKEAERKNALSLLLSALKAKEKDKLAPLTEDEENSIILKEIKQTKETLESAAGRDAIIKDCEFKIAVYNEFAPKRMDEGEIKATIEKVLADLGLENPTAKEKGIIMKNLMPLVSGKADGGLVNQLLGQYLK